MPNSHQSNTSQKNKEEKNKTWDLDREQTQQVKTAWTQEANEVNTNYMQQDNTRVKEWTPAQTADTKHVGVMMTIILSAI